MNKLRKSRVFILVLALALFWGLGAAIAALGDTNPSYTFAGVYGESTGRLTVTVTLEHPGEAVNAGAFLLKYDTSKLVLLERDEEGVLYTDFQAGGTGVVRSTNANIVNSNGVPSSGLIWASWSARSGETPTNFSADTGNTPKQIAKLYFRLADDIASVNELNCTSLQISDDPDDLAVSKLPHHLVVAYDGADVSPAVDASFSYPNSNKLTAPQITAVPDEEEYANDATVTVTLAAQAGADIYFTTDGSVPDADSSAYTGSFDIATGEAAGETVTVKAIAVQDGMLDSDAAVKFMVFAAKPTATVALQSGGSPVSSPVAVGNGGGSLNYTLNASGIVVGKDIAYEITEVSDASGILTLPASTTGTLTASAASHDITFTVAANAADQPAKSAEVKLSFTGEKYQDIADITFTVNLAKGPITTPTPDAGQFSITNAVGTGHDMVAVSGLTAGDVVKIYTAASGGAAIQTSAAATGTTMEITLDNDLAAPAGSLWFTLTGDGDLESARVKVDYTAAPAAQAPVLNPDLPATKEAAYKAASVSFSVTATVTDGGTLTYQWQKQNGAGWDILSGTGYDSDTYTISNPVAAVDNGVYRVLVTNTTAGATGSPAQVESTACTLTVALAPLAEALNVSVNKTGVISVASGAPAGSTLYYAVVGSAPSPGVDTWKVDLTLTAANALLEPDLTTAEPVLKAADNGKYLIVAAIKDGCVAAVGQSAALNIDKKVTSFEPLAPEVAAQVVAYGTLQGALHLPAQLSAMVDGNSETINGVTWTADPSYVATQSNTYVFTALLPGGYALSGVAAPSIRVSLKAAPSLTWGGSGFQEVAANNGSIQGFVTATLNNGEKYAADLSGKYTVQNVPTGLTAVVTRTSDTVVTLTLTGQAVNHASANYISNLTLSFLKEAVQGGATALSNSTKSNIAVSFTDTKTSQLPAGAVLSLSNTRLTVTFGEAAKVGDLIRVYTAQTGGSAAQTFTVTDEGGTQVILLDAAPSDNIYVSFESKATNDYESARVKSTGFVSTDASLSGGSLAGVPFDISGSEFSVTIRDEVKTNAALLFVQGNANACVKYDIGVDQPAQDSGYTAQSSVINAVNGMKLWILSTAEDGITKRYYCLTITVKDPEVVLDGLSLSEGILTPTFSGTVYHYAASVANRVDTVSLTPVLEGATFSVLKNGLADSVSEAAGTYTVSGLSVGNNTITIEAAKAGMTTMTYTVTVKRAAAASGGGGLVEETVEYTVNFAANDGSGRILAKKTVADGKTTTLPSDPSREGYTFKGWNTESDGSGSTFSASTKVKADLTVYAQWEPETDIPPDTGTHFSDVSGWAEEYINYLAERDIVQGKGDDTFAPDDHMNRAELAAILARINGGTLGGTAGTFSDVPSDAWYALAVAWGSQSGIIQGDNGRFLPGQNITREDIAVMIYRYVVNVAKISLPTTNPAVTFADNGEISEYAREAVAAMQQAGILSGRGDNRFAPQENVTRAEAAKMLAMLMQILGK